MPTKLDLLSLKKYYDQQRERITHRVAEDEHGELLGFYWATRDRLKPSRIYFDLFVVPKQRGLGFL